MNSKITFPKITTNSKLSRNISLKTLSQPSVTVGWTDKLYKCPSQTTLTKMVKFDPYKHKERYEKWRNKIRSQVPEVSKENSKLILAYLDDMEMGTNIAKGTKKGPRSYIRLNTLKQRMIFLSKEFKSRFSINQITDIEETQLFEFFQGLRSGKIKRNDGKLYKSAKDMAKDFKSFWHWHQKRSKKEGIAIEDISADLDTTGEKPIWVYLTEDQVKSLAESANYDYKVLIWFLYDTGIRAPTELMNIKVSDFFNDFKELNIRDEVSKTFGRRIKLMISSQLIKEYIKNMNLGLDDYLFTTSPASMNIYLKRLSRRILGTEKSPAGDFYHNLTLYDLRHCSCCYWLPRYKSESALKYRFGWKKSDKIHYYSELLGMKDTISEEDLLVDVTKIELERRLDKNDGTIGLLKDENEILKDQLKRIGKLVGHLYGRMKINYVEETGV